MITDVVLIKNTDGEKFFVPKDSTEYEGIPIIKLRLRELNKFNFPDVYLRDNSLLFADLLITIPYDDERDIVIGYVVGGVLFLPAVSPLRGHYNFIVLAIYEKLIEKPEVIKNRVKRIMENVLISLNLGEDEKKKLEKVIENAVQREFKKFYNVVKKNLSNVRYDNLLEDLLWAEATRLELDECIRKDKECKRGDKR